MSLTEDHGRRPSRRLAELGLAEFFEWQPPDDVVRENPELPVHLMMMDICLTERGWNFLPHAGDV